MTESSFILPNGKKRGLRDRLFGFCARLSIVLSLLFLLTLLSDTFIKSLPALYRYEITTGVAFDKAALGLPEKPTAEELKLASYSPLWQDSIKKASLATENPEKLRSIFRTVSRDSGFILRDLVTENSDLFGRNVSVTLPLSSRADYFLKKRDEELTSFPVRTSAILSAGPSQGLREFMLSVPVKRADFLAPLAKKRDFDKHDPSLLLYTEHQAYKILSLRVSEKNTSYYLTVKPLSSGSADDDITDQQKEATLLQIKTPEYQRVITDFSAVNLLRLEKNGAISTAFNKGFFLNGDSREGELAGIFGAIIGSFRLILVCLALAFPIGIAAAVYLQEFAKRSPLTSFLEVNINNLAAVPSIIYGLLGLAIFINWFGAPRSSPLAGGAVLALMSLPVIIIATRAALRSVPQSLRDGAAALGATKLQVFFHHTLPYAIPGIMTGTVLAISRALGETAPLLLIGMVAFIPDTPRSFTDEATALPVQIFLWSDNPDPSYAAKTSAAVLALLALILAFNAGAVYLRKKFTVRY
jgi:phosphate transport system permease protein